MSMTGLKLNPWIKFSDESMFIIDFDKVVTISEVTDKKIIKLYNRFLEENGRVVNNNRKKLSEKMGYLSSIADARISLERIYNKNSKI